MKRWRAASLAAAVALALSGCGGTGGGSSGNSGNDKGELLVWVDNTRTPAAQQYKKAHPDLKIRIVTIPPDAGYVPTKVSLANRTKRGWPDVVFLTNPAEAATLASEKFGYAAPLDGLVPKSVRDGFAPGSLDTCTFGGETYCLRNDIAPTVLWYDTSLMKEYGYQVPKTWADYQRTGLKAAEEHPGTIVGAINGKYGAGTYFGSSGCPTRDTLSLTKVHIDLTRSSCTRVADLLQPMAEKKAVTTVVPTDPAFAKLGKENKILMLPGPAWFGDFMFGPAFKIPKGRIAAAPMPTWPGETKSYAGQVGGGAFLVSAHAGDRTKEAADLVRWMTTDATLQADQPTYPAFTAAAQKWGEAKAKDPYYAADPMPALTAAANALRPGFGAVRFEADWQASFNDTVGKAADSGADLRKTLASWQDKLEAAAKTSEYSVG
ncbi:extracellular solute-binding protein [Streptomyces sporangiiformans]|uniref:Extracellular solute-binding protein n=1 Tax=Streptomyces sporangiiformans TaxID=2315329 RepID=A0A505CVK6_9ACTN|nr:extracellular solute-binding protein [Streptomyces sporangiiformans]TPQ15594.1 extracellular solute-binding protein [Streptomyces sporangiiformans]